jgi:hypothetical protein
MDYFNIRLEKWTMYTNRYFTEKEIQMALKYTKKL